MAKTPMPKKGAAKKIAASRSKSLSPAPPAKSAAKSPPPRTAKSQVKAGSKTVSTPAKAAKSPAKAESEKPLILPPPAPAVPILPPPPPELVLPSPPSPPHGAPPLSSLPKTLPLTVSVQTSQGAAAHGNTQPANILVIVTSAGWPVTDLDKNHFTLMQHFEVPGQDAPFSNSITTFRNAGTGAYLLQTKPINGAPWRTGHHLGQILVSSAEDQQGQAAFKLIIR